MQNIYILDANDNNFSAPNILGNLSDIIWGLGGNDTLRGNAGDDEINGGNGRDIVYGGTGNDLLRGGNDGDVLVGGVGADVLIGGSGIDRAAYNGAASAVRADLQFSNTNSGEAAGDTYFSIENMSGSRFSDRLLGNAGSNTIWGEGGSDSIFGRDGRDVLNGGRGNDSLYGGNGNDRLEGGRGNDLLNGGTGHDRLSGDNGADVLNGGGGNDRLNGDAGNDVLNGGGGNDRLLGGSGADQLNGGSGNDILSGGVGVDSFNGGSGRDRIDYRYSDGDWVIDLRAGEAEFSGGGVETLVSIEDVFGSQGDDSIYGTRGNNDLEGEQGNDRLYGRGGNDTLEGEAGQDTLNGGGGNDLLLGGASADVLIGGSGDDRLVGGLGIDTHYGGSGDDVFVFNSTAESTSLSRDVIVGFDAPGSFIAGAPGDIDTDRIDISNIDANTGLRDNQSFTFIGEATAAEAFAHGAGTLWVQNSGGETIVYGNVDGDAFAELQIRIQDGATDASAYNAGDFIGVTGPGIFGFAIDAGIAIDDFVF